MSNFILIPANMDSKRLLDKPLQKLKGEKTLLDYTYDRVKNSNDIEIRIITDSTRVQRYCMLNNISYLFTGEADNGSHRCALALKSLPLNVDTITNWQIDYPFVNIMDIIAGIERSRKKRTIVTFYYDENNISRAIDNNNVKVVGCKEWPWYFSRSIIPYKCKNWKIHIGIYIFPIEILKKYRNEKEKGFFSQLAKDEKLEQLEFMELGYPINILKIPKTLSVNTKLDLGLAREWIENNV